MNSVEKQSEEEGPKSSTATETDKSPTMDNTENIPKNFKWTCYRNLVVISVSYALVLTGVSCIVGVQSSLNAEKGLGTASLGVQTGTMIVQALFFNALVISKLDLKWSMLVGIALESVYIAGNTYPTWYTLIPAAAIAGFGRPLIRTAEAIYITKLANGYAQRLGGNPQSTKTKFFYIYYVFYCSARVFGNVASSLILGSGLRNFDLSVLSNTSLNDTRNFEEDTRYCGAKFCNGDSPQIVGNASHSSISVVQLQAHPEMSKVYGLCGFSFACIALAFLVNAFLLTPMDKVASILQDGDCQVDEPGDDVITRPLPYLLNTIKYWRKPQQLLIMPLTVYNGIDNAFWSADFTKAFVTCYFGIHWVGFVVAWYGLTSPISVFLASWFNKTKFRPLTFFTAFAAHMSVCIVLLNWVPTISALPSLFALSAAWGIGSGLLPSILSAMYGVLFEDNLQAAFSNYWLMDSLGAMMTYSWSNTFCMNVKIIIFMATLGIGILGYVMIELQLLIKRRLHTIGDKPTESSSLKTK